MTKAELLEYLAFAGEADADDIAQAFELPYPTAAMALLRATRQGLLVRRLDPDEGIYWYTLSEHGQRRLAYFRGETESSDLRRDYG